MRKINKVLIVLYAIGGVFALLSIFFTLQAKEVSVMSHCLANASILLLLLNLILSQIADLLQSKDREKPKDRENGCES